MSRSKGRSAPLACCLPRATGRRCCHGASPHRVWRSGAPLTAPKDCGTKARSGVEGVNTASPVVEQMRRKSPRKCKLEEFAILGIRKFDKFGVVGISCLTFSGKFRYNTGRIELLQSVSPNSPGLRFFLLCRSGRRHRSSGRSAPSGLPLRHDPLGPVPALVPDHPGHRPAAAGAGRGARRAESVSFLRQRKK